MPTSGNDDEKKVSCELIVEEHQGICRVDEPVSIGIPFSAGVVFGVTHFKLLNPAQESIPLQTQVVSQWPDGSTQWVLLDFFANVKPHCEVRYLLDYQQMGDPGTVMNSMVLRENPESLMVETGHARFFIDTKILRPFSRVEIGGRSVLSETDSCVSLTGREGELFVPWISNITVEATGPIRSQVKLEGDFYSESKTLAHFIARLKFYGMSGFVEMNLTIRNEQAALHRGGLWDLGYEGSVYFSDLCVHLAIHESPNMHRMWKTQPLADMKHQEGGVVEIYQDSSGGENWHSVNHVNRNGEIPLRFAGYQVVVDEALVEEGTRATPTLSLCSPHRYISGTMEHFWQNFPKGLSIDKRGLNFEVFPKKHGDVYELQGGEQKTHTLYFQFSVTENGSACLEWVHDRLCPRSTPEWYAQSQAVKYLTQRQLDRNKEYCQLIDSIVEGSNTFFHCRENIDEYGWRNFGEIYADHESVGYEGGLSRVSHYNNQYDVVFGLLVEYLRTGNRKWFFLMRDLARHVIDIDLYHTQKDRPAYNGGLFWHSDHYCEAGTSTHRTYSKTNLLLVNSSEYGGGPSNEHNYTTGLLQYYFLTGDHFAKEGVLGLSNWVLEMDRGRDGIIGWMDGRPSGRASATVEQTYHGPGRGAANSINALLDGFRINKDDKFIAKAEDLIRRCIHPEDDIEQREFSDVENRWSYTMFLQALGKYLDFKVDGNELDDMFVYARESLLRYADWMAEYEVPYMHVLHRVKIPTETWPAQDIRKSNVFNYAAKYANQPQRALYLEKAEFFFNASISDLLSFETCYLTRPRVLVLVNGYMHSYFQCHPDEVISPVSKTFDFGKPCAFTPQLSQIFKMKQWLSSMVSLAKGRGKE